MSSYQKINHREHVLKRPNMYIGDIEPYETEDYIINNKKIEKKSYMFYPGLYKIIDEIIVNAIDHTVRDNTVKFIDVSYNASDRSICITNDGENIPPIKKDIKEKIYIPELIFGHLLTSQNYNDDEERIVGGMNGLGSKLTNIFSSMFKVEIHDHDKSFSQTYKENMSKKSKIKISTFKKPKNNSRLKLTFIPDYKRLGFNDTFDDNDVIYLLMHRVLEICACIKPTIIVSFNKKRVNIKGFISYVKLFVTNYALFENERWQIIISKNDTNETFKCISFVNGIRTRHNGTHVDYIINQVVKKLLNVAKRKLKNSDDIRIKPSYIRDNLFVIINSKIVNPSFDSQTKNRLITKSSNFGSTVQVNDDFIKKLVKYNVLENVMSIAEENDIKQSMNTLKTLNSGKRQRILIDNFEDAINAGTSKSQECCLILCEGLSAKSMVMSSFGIISRKTYGVYPLKGKILNVRDCSMKKIIENKEIQDICKILGIHISNKTSKRLPRYGKIIIMTDSDVDGFHIKNLILNFFYYFWGTSLSIEIKSLLTPIVKCAKPKTNVLEFYDLKGFEKWKQQISDINKWKIKYYKGLGSSTKEEAQGYFRKMKLMSYSYDEDTDKQSLELGFQKNMSNERKQWIMEKSGITDENTYFENTNVSVTDCINNELILYSLDSITRAIPSAIDGLKQSQRKILYAALKRNIETELKVSQFSGYVSEHTSYHHGEQSLNETIIGMCQDFVSSTTNINLLEPIGQFGSRLHNGKDHASSRYIFTKINPITKTLFDERDNDLLEFLNDDGFCIEPLFYVPILPLILINGSCGIATGFSTSVPCFNPEDIVNNIERLNEGEDVVEMTPWFRGFKGDVVKISTNKWITIGKFENDVQTKQLRISELPIGMSIEQFKMLLCKLETETDIVDSFINNSTDNEACFEIKLKDIPSNILETFRLTTSINATNLHGLGLNGEIIKFNTPEDILKYHYGIRLEYYEKRKHHMLDLNNMNLNRLLNKKRFIEYVIDDKIIVFKRNRKDIIKDMERLSFTDMNELLSIKLHVFDNEHLKGLDHEINKIVREIEYLNNSSNIELWECDIEKIKKK